MLYRNFIDQINTYKIKEVHFSINGFSHYKECKIFHHVDIIRNGKEISLIVCQLTTDEYEKVSFLGEFDETYKLFDFGRKGKFTLKQIWDNVIINEIEYAK